jgi:DNA mismatch repair protein MutS2
MDERSLKPLEYDKIRQMLAGQASTTLGQELAAAIAPSSDQAEVVARLSETAEAYTVLQAGDRPPLGGVTDIREPIKRAELGGALAAAELLAVAEFLRAARGMRGFLRDRQRDCPGLASQASTMSPPDEVIRAIGAAITDEGEVADGASPKLASIRRNLRVLSDRIRERMNSFLRSQEHVKALQEPIITIREGRFVLPVRNDSRNVIPGVVHDVSSSGATVYVEPLGCVQHNNDLRRLAVEEDDEVRRILAELSWLVGAHAVAVAHCARVMAAVDFAFAKARLGLAMRASRPEVAANTYVDLPSARHPLIPPEAVVPVDVRIGRDFTVLVITGPNTGGKTVTLKTVGLLSLMAQSGLFVPAGRGAVVTVFDQILADIGDEQSIEQSLSTFSSHMTSIVRILGLAGPRSLVLLDEIGAGTDPTEGAALATALLEEFHARGCRTIATTHYGQLKEFAYSHSGVANASVSFDAETLAPTYKLNIGVPGPSNALAIARRLGLARSIVNRASELVGEDQIKIEEMIQRLLAERDRLASERDQLAALRREAAALKLELQVQSREQQERWTQAMARVRGELRQTVVAARDEFDGLIKELRGLAMAGDRKDRERGITELRERFRSARQAAEDVVGDERPADTAGGAVTAAALKPGLKVRLLRLGQTGFVLDGPDAAGQVPVQVGIMRVMARVDELAPAPDDVAGGQPASGPGQATQYRSRVPGAGSEPGGGVSLAGTKLRAFSSEIDLRGQTVEEAIPQVDKYIDDALLAGVKQVRLIHGKGTGALREGLTAHLRGHSGVAALSLAPFNEGGDGVTVVELR